jgi:hypothetical protein
LCRLEFVVDVFGFNCSYRDTRLCIPTKIGCMNLDKQGGQCCVMFGG